MGEQERRGEQRTGELDTRKKHTGEVDWREYIQVKYKELKSIKVI